MRLLLADDHGLFRDALVNYIERETPDTVVMLARDVHEVMEIMEGDPALDLILMDLRMPGMNGLQGLQKLREIYPDIKVALLSGLAEAEDVERALAMGACGYFPKTLSGKAMVKGIQQILEGDVYVARNHNTNEFLPSYYGDDLSWISGRQEPSGMGEGMQEAIEGGAGSLRLTPRETEVLSHLTQGKTNKDIARALDLQVVTVKLHIRGICRKLGASNRTQAALLAKKKGF